MPRLLYVTSRERRDLYQSLTAAFSGQDYIDVVLDRRLGERRRGTGGNEVERRQLERRHRRQLDAQLRQRGSFITTVDPRTPWTRWAADTGARP